MKPYIPIKIYRWFSKDNYKIYLFDKSKDSISDKNTTLIKEYIYQDDNLEDALNKIALYIKHIEKDIGDKFYCWNKKTSLSHKINNIIWKGYNVNPFLSVDRKSKQLDEEISYNLENKLFDLERINIVFQDDMPDDLKQNKYYFLDRKKPSYQIYKNKDQNLFNLISQETKNIKKINEKYHRVDLYCKLSNKIILSNLFDNLQTKKNIALIQWINDTSKILYKIQKNHYIKYEQLYNWCNIDKISRVNCINIYYIIAKSCYCKITITNEGNIIFSYIFDIRRNIRWDIIKKSKDILVNYLQKHIKEKIRMEEVSLKLNISFAIDNTTFSNLTNKISSFIDIFAVKLTKNKDKQTLNCVYKRSSNYSENLNINDYILSRYNLGITKEDIVNELINLGLTENTKDEVDNVIDNIDLNLEKKFIKKKDNGTIVNIIKSNIGFDIEIINSANYKELNYLIYWITKIISASRNVVIKKEQAKKQIIPEKTSPKIEEKEVDDYDLDKIDSDNEDEKLGELEYDLGDDDDDDLLMGGAIGKDKHSYFVNLIEAVDKPLIANNYARDKCQSDFQPIVLTKEEKENLEKNKMTHYDNILEYGSSKNRLNYYICPRLWCPISKIPLNVDDPEAKCPVENEQPMKLFFDKNPNKKRYIKLIKPDEKGLCAPCCGKKQQKKEELDKCKILSDEIDLDDEDDKTEIKSVSISIKKDDDKSVKKDDKDINYLMNQRAPIPQNRYGSIPEALHNLLLNDVPYSMCSKIINKTQKCFIKKGIVHRNTNIKENIVKNDSILYCIAELLGFKNKKLLINDIIKKLDIITYISLENGEICKSFMDIREIIAENNTKLKKSYNKNKKLFNILKSNDDKDMNSLSRLLNIYKSYKKFINFLSSDDYPIDKTPYYLYLLVATLYKKLLIIWEYSGDSEVNILCPVYSSYSDILTSLELNPEVLMILKDGSYYEPIEFKNKYELIDNNIRLNNFPNVLNVLNECNKHNNKYSNTFNIYQNLYTYYQWIATTGDNYSRFNIDTIFINNDLSLSFVLTKNNILLNFDKISISVLPKLITDMNIKKILFFDDIIKTNINITNISKDVYAKIVKKCDQLDIRYIIGDILSSDDKLFSSNINIPEQKLTGQNIIHTNTRNGLYNYIENENKISYNWFNLQKYIADVLIKKYNDTKFNNLYGTNKKIELINNLYDKYFEKLNNKNIVKIILEELPIYNTLTPITNVSNWINNIILYYKYDFMSSIVKDKKDELVFSQNALFNDGKYTIPELLLKYHKSMPNSFSNFDNYILKDLISTNQNSNVELPSIFFGDYENMKSKWVSRKKGKWVNMAIVKSKYTKDKFIEFVNWLSQYLNIRISYDEINNIVNSYYRKIIIDKRYNLELFEDPSLLNEWFNNIKIKPISKQKFISEYFNKYTNADLNRILDNIISENKLFPSDITFKVISDVFNISILLIHRIKYGSTTESDKRNDLNDLKLSSTFISATNNMDERPLFIFEKNNDKTSNIYYPVIEKNETNITINNLYMKYKLVPDNIKLLISLHMK